jgi:hypothetical protein
MRRIIFPLLVFGNSGTTIIFLGVAIAPIDSRTLYVKIAGISAFGTVVGFKVTNAINDWPLISSGAPTTAASAHLQQFKLVNAPA